jgi:hypothetical protein
LGYILGDFSTNYSGHPAEEVCLSRPRNGFVQEIFPLFAQVQNSDVDLEIWETKILVKNVSHRWFNKKRWFNFLKKIFPR